MLALCHGKMQRLSVISEPQYSRTLRYTEKQMIASEIVHSNSDFVTYSTEEQE